MKKVLTNSVLYGIIYTERERKGERKNDNAWYYYGSCSSNSWNSWHSFDNRKLLKIFEKIFKKYLTNAQKYDIIYTVRGKENRQNQKERKNYDKEHHFYRNRRNSMEHKNRVQDL